MHAEFKEAIIDADVVLRVWQMQLHCACDPTEFGSILIFCRHTPAMAYFEERGTVALPYQGLHGMQSMWRLNLHGSCSEL